MTILAECIGNVAGVLMLIALVPQIHHMLERKEARGVSLPFSVLLFVVSVLYTIYGAMIDALPILITNVVSSVMTFGIVFLKVHYDGWTWPWKPTLDIPMVEETRMDDILEQA